jgi:hypothetical protein
MSVVFETFIIIARTSAMRLSSPGNMGHTLNATAKLNYNDLGY